MTQMSINWLMDEQNVLYTYNGILLDNKKKWSIDTCYRMDELRKQYAKWKDLLTKTVFNVQNRKIQRDKRQMFA